MRSRRNKLGIVFCLLALGVLAVSVWIRVGCSYNDQAFVLANGNFFVLELLGSPRSEGFGRDLIWTGFRLWRMKLNSSGFPAIGSSSIIIIPWLISVVILGGSLRILWLRPIKKRNDFDRCQECGYNLTGNVSGVCPECGTPIEAESGTSNG